VGVERRRRPANWAAAVVFRARRDLASNNSSRRTPWRPATLAASGITSFGGDERRSGDIPRRDAENGDGARGGNMAASKRLNGVA